MLIIIAIIVFLPETMRSIAGNGAIRLKGPVYKPLIRYIRKEPRYMQDPDGPLNSNKVTIWTFLRPFRLFREKDLVINLIWGGFVYAIWNMVTTSTTPVFKARFPFLDELLLGVAFLPNGKWGLTLQPFPQLQRIPTLLSAEGSMHQLD